MARRKPRDLYKPYVRRANGRERSESLRVAVRLAFYQELGRPFYVMVQRGWPNLAIACGRTKEDVKRQPLLVRRLGFSGWANRVKRLARGDYVGG